MPAFLPSLVTLFALGLAVITASWQATVFCAACMLFALVVDALMEMKRGR